MQNFWQDLRYGVRMLLKKLSTRLRLVRQFLTKPDFVLTSVKIPGSIGPELAAELICLHLPLPAAILYTFAVPANRAFRLTRGSSPLWRPRQSRPPCQRRRPRHRAVNSPLKPVLTRPSQDPRSPSPPRREKWPYPCRNRRLPGVARGNCPQAPCPKPSRSLVLLTGWKRLGWQEPRGGCNRPGTPFHNLTSNKLYEPPPLWDSAGRKTPSMG